jgi:hypothetical protein
LRSARRRRSRFLGAVDAYQPTSLDLPTGDDTGSDTVGA